MNTAELTLPTAPDAERFVLGSIMLDDSLYLESAGVLTVEAFSDDRHRRIFVRMSDLHERGEKIDRITVYHELDRHGETEAIGGLGYLISLDDGLPKISNIDAYVRLVREKADLRRVMLICQRLMDRAAGEREQSDVLLSEMASAAIDSGERDGEAQTVGQIIQAAGGLQTYLNREGKGGLKIGFPRFDSMTDGLHGGELFILAARPSMGKTALALNIAGNVGQQGKHVAIFSLETGRDSLVDRLIASRSLTNSYFIKRGESSPESRARIGQTLPPVWDTIHIQDRFACAGMDIHAECRRIKSRTGLSLAIIDYLQLMAGKGENQNQVISAISRGLKLMAKDLNIPVILLSQLSRAVETRQGGDHRPQLSDLRDSGAIEQDADLVGFIYRPEVYKTDRPDLEGVAELILAKQRDGETGRIPLIFRKQFVRFDSALEGAEQEPEQ